MSILAASGCNPFAGRVSELIQGIEASISEATGEPFTVAESAGLGGGCISRAQRIRGMDGREFFCKSNSVDLLPSFEAEAYSLKVISDTETIRVPKPIATCSTERESCLILEYLPMDSAKSGNWSEMGRLLAHMHRFQNETHGWDHDNWIGSMPQLNKPHSEWIEFFAECRLQPQLKWAAGKGLRIHNARDLIDGLPALFQGYQPTPSLLHGDLWAGNGAFLNDGTPVIFDPASYYGDREADLAMTEMFGGYSMDFYRGYNAEWPLDAGYKIRKHLYILYHALNHYNLFGGGYGSQAMSLVNQLIRNC